MSEFDPTQHPVPDDDVFEAEVQADAETQRHVDQEFDRGEAEMLQQDGIDLSTPVEETPPAPTFLIVPNRYGPGTTGVYLPDGRPVGIWMSEDYSDLTPTQVVELLASLGMEGNLADSFASQRGLRDDTAMEIVDNPALVEFTQNEEEREERLKEVRAAFVKAQKK